MLSASFGNTKLQLLVRCGKAHERLGCFPGSFCYLDPIYAKRTQVRSLGWNYEPKAFNSLLISAAAKIAPTTTLDASSSHYTL